MKVRTMALLAITMALTVAAQAWSRGTALRTRPRIGPGAAKSSKTTSGNKTVSQPLEKLLYFSVPPAAFRPMNDVYKQHLLPANCYSYKLGGSLTLCFNEAGNPKVWVKPPKLVAPLHIPRGATLKELKVTFKDNVPGMHADIAMYVSGVDRLQNVTSSVYTASRVSTKGQIGKVVGARKLKLRTDPSTSYYLKVQAYVDGRPPDKARIEMSRVRIGYVLDE